MGVYNSGSVRVKSGSAEVRGNSTAFNLYVSSGNVFKIVGESTFYTIAAITSATKLTLSSRYSNVAFQTGRASNIATVTSATKMYSGYLANTPVIQSKVAIKVVAHEKFIDNGAGVLTGSLGGAGTIGYDDGSWHITLGAAVGSSKVVNASYNSGDTLEGQSYQIVKDYTTYFKLPEASPTDQNLAYIYTKAVRMLDERLYNASQLTATIGSLTLSGSLKSKAVSKSDTYTATAANRWIVYTGNTASKTLTLYNASSKNKFKEVYVINNSNYTIRISRKGSDVINASTIIKLKSRYKSFHGYVATTNLWVRVK